MLHTALAYGTLIIDAYLALASVATRMMKAEYASSLLPFGDGEITERTRLLLLMVATWTAALAVSSLRVSHSQPESPGAPGALWFALVLATVWAVYLAPLMINALQSLLQ